MKVNIFVPAGQRVMAGDFQGRPEFIARQDWGRTSEFQEASEGGVGFGLQLQAPELLPLDFSPKILNGLYGIHADNEGLTKLYKAEQAGDQKYIEEFWAHIDLWSKWVPRPIYVVFHGAGLGTIPPLDHNRFNLSIEPEDWLKQARWHERVFAKMREKGLDQVVLETVFLNNYYGPPYFPQNWLPITYLAPRVGIYHDIIEITHAAGVGSLVDFEHLAGTIDALNREAIEIQELKALQFANAGSYPNFERYFGFSAQKGKTCQAVEPVSWEGLVSELKTPFYHVGGIQPQVIQLEPSEAQTDYHQALHQQLKDCPYAWGLARLRRGGSHSKISRDDIRFREMLRYVLQINKNLERLILVVETAEYREGKELKEDSGFWYWAEPKALEVSLRELRQILLEELEE